MATVLRLPDHGRLLVCTDLQGCLRDFDTIATRFLQAWEESEEDAHLLFTGDLIHGPYIEPEDWPTFLGEYYRDQSGEVCDQFAALRNHYPGHVHAILGNHEHGHIGGPHTAKFAMDEVALLEYQLGPAHSHRIQELFNSFPLAAVAPCGTVFTHGAPAAQIESLTEVEQVDVNDFDCESPLDILQVPVLGPILWARSATEQAAQKFVQAMGGKICIYGHDVIPSGFERIGHEQMVVSTSFGVFDSNKVYLDLDLAAHYTSVHQLRVGHEIRALYPDKAPQFRAS